MRITKLVVAGATVASVVALPSTASAGDCNFTVASCNVQAASQSNSITVTQSGTRSSNLAVVFANQQNFLHQTQVNAARVRIGR